MNILKTTLFSALLPESSTTLGSGTQSPEKNGEKHDRELANETTESKSMWKSLLRIERERLNVERERLAVDRERLALQRYKVSLEDRRFG